MRFAMIRSLHRLGWRDASEGFFSILEELAWPNGAILAALKELAL
jgi:hypothetical protein